MYDRASVASKALRNCDVRLYDNHDQTRCTWRRKGMQILIELEAGSFVADETMASISVAPKVLHTLLNRSSGVCRLIPMALWGTRRILFQYFSNHDDFTPSTRSLAYSFILSNSCYCIFCLVTIMFVCRYRPQNRANHSSNIQPSRSWFVIHLTPPRLLVKP